MKLLFSLTNLALFSQKDGCCYAGILGGAKKIFFQTIAVENNKSCVLLLVGDVTLNSLISEAFVQFFVEIVGHYSLHMNVTEQGERVFQREPFRKSHTSRNVRHFLDLFMETQMFAGFIQDRELRKSGVKGEVCHSSCFILLFWCRSHFPIKWETYQSDPERILLYHFKSLETGSEESKGPYPSKDSETALCLPSWHFDQWNAGATGLWKILIAFPTEIISTKSTYFSNGKQNLFWAWSCNS